MTGEDLFDSHADAAGWREEIDDGVVLLHHYGAGQSETLLDALREVIRRAPFRQRITPGGRRMSVAMSNCGRYGWVTDEHGYRYVECEPESGRPWPDMPPLLRTLAQSAAQQAGFPAFDPDACLINRYVPGAKMALHQDKDEADFSAPIVSVSLGLPVIFQLGGMQRADSVRRLLLEHGDVLVWGGPARLRYHGVSTLKTGRHSRLGEQRINLTFRRAK